MGGKKKHIEMFGSFNPFNNCVFCTDLPTSVYTQQIRKQEIIGIRIGYLKLIYTFYTSICVKKLTDAWVYQNVIYSLRWYECWLYTNRSFGLSVSVYTRNHNDADWTVRYRVIPRRSLGPAWLTDGFDTNTAGHTASTSINTKKHWWL